jgi:hypothetical protein
MKHVIKSLQDGFMSGNVSQELYCNCAVLPGIYRLLKLRAVLINRFFFSMTSSIRTDSVHLSKMS